jgi:hypothetical protein
MGHAVKRCTMAREIIFVVEESPEGGFEARAVSHSVFAEAETLDELRTRIQDAVRCHFEPADMPDLIRLHQVRDEVIAA